jgi:hypothetical protein
MPPLEYIDATKIKAPVMAHWAEQDQAFPIASVDALEEKLRAAGVRYRVIATWPSTALPTRRRWAPAASPSRSTTPVGAARLGSQLRLLRKTPLRGRRILDRR